MKSVLKQHWAAPGGETRVWLSSKSTKSSIRISPDSARIIRGWVEHNTNAVPKLTWALPCSYFKPDFLVYIEWRQMINPQLQSWTVFVRPRGGWDLRMEKAPLSTKSRSATFEKIVQSAKGWSQPFIHLFIYRTRSPPRSRRWWSWPLLTCAIKMRPSVASHTNCSSQSCLHSLFPFYIPLFTKCIFLAHWFFANFLVALLQNGAVMHQSSAFLSLCAWGRPNLFFEKFGGRHHYEKKRGDAKLLRERKQQLLLKYVQERSSWEVRPQLMIPTFTWIHWTRRDRNVPATELFSCELYENLQGILQFYLLIWHFKQHLMVSHLQVSQHFLSLYMCVLARAHVCVCA